MRIPHAPFEGRTFVDVRYGISFRPPSVEKPDENWSVFTWRKDPLERFGGRTHVAEQEFSCVPTRDSLSAWLTSVFPADPTLVTSLVTEAMSDLCHEFKPYDGAVLVASKYHLLSFTVEAEWWWFDLFRQQDSYFFYMANSRVGYVGKPSRKEVECDMRTTWRISDELISYLLNELLQLQPDAFTTESVTKKVKTPRKRSKST